MMPEARNLLLRLMTEKDRTVIMSAAEHVVLARRQILEEAWQSRRFVHFIESGMVSSLAVFDVKPAGELGLVGYEGMTGTSLLFGDDRAASTLHVDTPGEAYRLPAKVLSEILLHSDTLLPFLLRFARAQALQMASTAAANSHSGVNPRLARRLLMALDRSPGRTLESTHDDLSLRLDTRRPSVTTAMCYLESRRFVRKTRGNVEVTDREGLVRFASPIYGIAEKEYARLLGTDFRLNMPSYGKGMDVC